MNEPAKKPTKKHFVEIPNNISKMSDAQIYAWAKKAYDQMIPVLKDEGFITNSEDNA